MANRREWLILLRNQQHITQQQVADAASIDRSSYSLIESGRRTPSVTTAQSIAKALKFDWVIFFANNSGMKQQTSEQETVTT
jgi:transcriptional regulator with XRE-family HTH domain